ncbi:hypothetical protein NMG60_11022465 [Bertholletia excelsa]
MSQPINPASTSTPSAPPMKRKRGRPRKDESLVQKENAKSPQPQPAPTKDVRSNQHLESSPSNGTRDEMVGQVVSGVIEGCFDAGYLLAVRVGNSKNVMRGLVFQQGLFTPITAANDIVPHAKMFKRREFPIPPVNPQIPGDRATPQPEKRDELDVQLKNQAPTSSNQNLAPGYQHVPASKPASDLAPAMATLPENVADTLLGGQEVQQQEAKLGFEKKSMPSGLATQSDSVKHGPPKITEFGLGKQATVGSSSTFPFSNQSSFSEVSVTESLPSNYNSCASSGVKSVPQIGVESRFANQFPSTFSFSTPATLPFTGTFGSYNSSNSFGGKDFHQPNSDAEIEKQSGIPLQSAAPFPPGGGFVSVTFPPTNTAPEHKSDASMGGGDVPAPLTVPLIDNLPKDNLGAPLGEKEMPQKILEFSLDSRPMPSLLIGTHSSSVAVPPMHTYQKNELGRNDLALESSAIGLGDPSTELGSKRVSEQEELMQEDEASSLLEGPKVDTEGSKDMVMQEKATEVTVDVFSDKDEIIRMTQIQSQAVYSDKPVFSIIDASELMQLDNSGKLSGRDEITQIQKLSHEASNHSQGVSESAMGGNERDKTNEEGNISEQDLRNKGEGNQSLPRTNQPITFMPEKADSPRCEVEDGRTLLSGDHQIPSL